MLTFLRKRSEHVNIFEKKKIGTVKFFEKSENTFLRKKNEAVGFFEKQAKIFKKSGNIEFLDIKK